jgi:hypothetical protein
MVIRISQREKTEAHGNVAEALSLILEARELAKSQARRAGSLKEAGVWLSISSGLTAALVVLQNQPKACLANSH